MDMSLLVRGTILGFSIAAPVGPIGVLVVRESMTAGRKAGLLTGLRAGVTLVAGFSRAPRRGGSSCPARRAWLVVGSRRHGFAG